MWIEIRKPGNYLGIINSNKVVSVSYGLIPDSGKWVLLISMEGKEAIKLIMEDEDTSIAWYMGMMLALQGLAFNTIHNEYIKPLCNSQRDEIYKEMLYHKVQADLASCD